MISPIRGAVLSAVVIALGGCAPCQDHDVSPCPTPFSVRGFCDQYDICALDGIQGWCAMGGCAVGSGQEVTVPMDEIAAKITLLQDLYVDFRNADPSGPKPSSMHALIDGQAGVQRLSPREGAPAAVVFRWSPMPPAPKLLALRFDGGGSTTVDVDLRFEDAPCEEANPPSACDDGL